MKELADLLEKLDAYFDGKRQSEKLVLIALPALLVGYLAWSLIAPSAKASFDRSVADKKTIETKLQEDKDYMSSITRNGDKEYFVKDYNKKIALTERQSDLYREKIGVLNKNLDKMSDMLFNQKSWSIFLDSITQYAHNNDIDLSSINNKYVDSNGSFGHVLEVGITCHGSFSGIVTFMNDMEQNTLVTDIYRSRIYTDANSTMVNADINISVWGVNH